MGEKKAPRLTPEQNEARQATRAAARERAKDARLIAQLAVDLYNGRAANEDVGYAVGLAFLFLAQAKDAVR